MPCIKVNDINIYYEISGDGQPLLLIPSLSSDISDWGGIIARLSKSYKVIALDNRGAGRSDKPDMPYSIEMMASDASGVMDALEIKQAHILGISMGGRIALALALSRPELVKSLILVSTGMKPAERRTLTNHLLLDFTSRFSKLRGSPKYPQPYYAFVRQRAASRGYDATERLQEIKAPTLILHGRKDRLAPYNLAVEMHERIKDSKMVSFNGGHLFFILQARQFMDAILEFLGSLS